MKFTILTGFMIIWLSAILVPSIITVITEGEKTVIVFGHNEEEQKEGEKKDASEEKITGEESFHESLLPYSEVTSIVDFTLNLIPCHIQDIPLPPPELTL